MTATPVIETRSLSVRLGSRRVLSDLTLAVEPGAVGLLGPNGAGKTTLIRVLLGLLRPRRGQVRVLGLTCPRQARRIRAAVGYMPEEPVHLPGKNAVESVALLAQMSGLPRAEALQRTHEVLWYVGLGEARYRPVETFSTGMRQRFKLAAALVHDPTLLVLDEPTNGLDPTGRREMLELLRDLAGNHGKSILLCTHLVGDVEEVCRRVVVLDRGRLVREAAVEVPGPTTHTTYRLRLSGDAQAMIAGLREAGLVAGPVAPGPETGGAPVESGSPPDASESAGEMLEVRWPTGAPTTPLFAAARQAGLVVLSLEPRTRGMAEQLADWLMQECEVRSVE